MMFLLIAGLLLWFWTLVSVLGNKEMKDADRIVWIIVLCTLNIPGMVLYWFLAPSAHPARSEKELKDYFNSRDDSP